MLKVARLVLLCSELRPSLQLCAHVFPYCNYKWINFV
jgi:hypothetical protein